MSYSSDQFPVEEFAQKACSAIDHQVKQHAETLFMSFTLAYPVTLIDYHRILNNYSPIVVFVFVKYLDKCLHQLQPQPILTTVSQIFMDWQTPNCQFIRNHQVLERYVEKTIALLLGNCLKKLYQDQKTRDWTVKWIIGLDFKPRYKLYMWKIFIEGVSNVDTSMGFINYRSMVGIFQEEIIPQITDSLIPYFLSVEENIRVNELSQMQSQLTMDEKKANQPEDKLVFTPEEILFTDLVFGLLKEVICFNYNITYSEYEQDMAFQNCLVTFPELLISKIISKEFLESLYFIVDKLINEFHQPKRDQFLETCFDCLKKVVMTKTTYIEKQKKDSFIWLNMEGMNSLSKLIIFSHHLTNQNIRSIIECNMKLILGFQLVDIKLAVSKFQGGLDTYYQWLNNLTEICSQIIGNTEMHCNNQLLTSAADLIQKILCEAISLNLKQDAPMFQKIASKISEEFFRKFFSQDHNLLGGIRLRQIAQLKKMSSLFFSSFKKILAINYSETMSYLKGYCVQIFRNGTICQISNLILFISDLVEISFFEKNLMFVSSESKDINSFGECLQLVMQFIDFYRGNQSSNNEGRELITSSILIFIEKMLVECISNMEVKEPLMITITSKLYGAMAVDQKPLILDDQDFILFCFRQIISNLNTTDILKIEYTFEVISSLLLKLKWAMKREYFKNTKTLKEMQEIFANVSQNNLNNNLMRWRTKLYKIIAVLSFDDVLDSFRENIEASMNLICFEISNGNFMKAVYDLTGVFDTIDTASIYRCFINTFEKKIGVQHFFETLFRMYFNDEECLKDILKLNVVLLENKSQRLTNNKNSTKVYEMIENLLPFWNQILSYLNENLHLGSLIKQMYRLLNSLLKGNHVNFALLEKYTEHNYNSFIFLILTNMKLYSKQIEQRPDIYQIYMSNLVLIARELPEVILTSRSAPLIQVFDELISEVLVGCSEALSKFLQGNSKSYENIVEKYLDFVKYIFSYIKNALKIIHRTEQLENIKVIIENSMGKEQYLGCLFRFGIGNGKNYSSLMRTICLIISYMTSLFMPQMEQILYSLGIEPEKKLQFNKIIESLHLEEDEEELFAVRLKDWLKVNDEHHVDFDY